LTSFSGEGAVASLDELKAKSKKMLKLTCNTSISKLLEQAAHETHKDTDNFLSR
jgi:uncharacterized protein (DUF1778 family)